MGADLHLLPSAALARGTGGADAPPARRPDDAGDRPRLPRSGGDGRAAAGAGEEDAARGAGPVRGAAWNGAGRAPALGARSRLPRLQRGLRGERRRGLGAARSLRGSAAARPHPAPPGPRRAGGARFDRAAGDPSLAIGCAARPRGRTDPAARTGPQPLGPPADRPRPAGVGASRRTTATARPLRPTGRDSRLPRAGDPSRGNRLGPNRSPSRGSRNRPAFHHRRAEPRGGPGHGLRPRGGPGPPRRDRRREGPYRLPPPPQRPRRPPGESGPHGRGSRRVQARGRADGERTRARASPPSRRFPEVGKDTSKFFVLDNSEYSKPSRFGEWRRRMTRAKASRNA